MFVDVVMDVGQVLKGWMATSKKKIEKHKDVSPKILSGNPENMSKSFKVPTFTISGPHLLFMDFNQILKGWAATPKNKLGSIRTCHPKSSQGIWKTFHKDSKVLTFTSSGPHF